MEFCGRHVDHSGGLPEAVEAISKARQKAVLVDLHPDRPARRGFMLDAGTVPLNPVRPCSPLSIATGYSGWSWQGPAHAFACVIDRILPLTS
jgi:hypothetical protein